MINIEEAIMNRKKLLTAEKVKKEITFESVKKEILEGWTNPFTIASNILGTETWDCLPDWDQKIIVAIVHKIAVENPELRKKYFG